MTFGEVLIDFYAMFGVYSNVPVNAGELFPWLATCLLATCIIASIFKGLFGVMRLLCGGRIRI